MVVNPGELAAKIAAEQMDPGEGHLENNIQVSFEKSGRQRFHQLSLNVCQPQDCSTGAVMVTVGTVSHAFIKKRTQIIWDFFGLFLL